MSKLFSVSNKKLLEKFSNEILVKLNNFDLHISEILDPSPRVVGDVLESAVNEIFATNMPKKIGTMLSGKFARRAMADLAFDDNMGGYNIVDVKTHNIATDFNMPNLTSVKRLSDFYMDDENTFVILILEYSLENNIPVVKNIYFSPIEWFSFKCLTIGAIGWGQLQIANSNNIIISKFKSRKKWMLEFLDVLDLFYPKEISKISDRMEHFKEIRRFWEAK